MIEIKRYSPDYENAHIAFAQKYWTKKRRLTPDYIYWKFRGVPGQELNAFILAFDGAKVVGQFGMVPCQVIFNKIVIDGQWACDLMVDFDYRGKGVAEKLYDFAHQNKPITLGSDPSPAAEKSMVKKGYLSLDGPRKFVFPIKIGEIFKLKGIKNGLANKIPNPFLLILYFFKNNNFKQITASEYQAIKQPEEVNYLQCHYNTDFFNWRFSAFKNYYNGIDCYQDKDVSLFTGYLVSGIYHLTDFKVNNLLSFLKLIAFIYFKYRKSGIMRIKFVSIDAVLNSKLPFLGFILFRTRTKIIVFSPLEKIKSFIKNEKFRYTLHDSDENI
jgi:GNAT superfamily N-acetyltransferase